MQSYATNYRHFYAENYLTYFIARHFFGLFHSRIFGSIKVPSKAHHSLVGMKSMYIFLTHLAAKKFTCYVAK